jgi:osmotically inducible lipoprotein OsmB
MQKQTLIIMALCATTLAGCLENDIERGAAGALGGAVISEVTGGSALTGAVIGGAGGLLCDDLGVCK